MRIVLKIIMIILFVLLVTLDIWIVKNFNDNTERAGVIDKNENFVIDPIYWRIDGEDLQNGYKYLTAKKVDFIGETFQNIFLDLDGNEQNSSMKAYFNMKSNDKYFSENRALVWDEETGKKGYVDWDGNLVIDYKYDVANTFKDGYALVCMKDEDGLKYGVIDLEGNEILPCVYPKLSMIDSGCGIFYYDEDDKIIILNDKNMKIGEIDTENKKYKFTNFGDLSNLGELEEENVNFSKDFIVIIDEDEKYEIYTKDGKRANDIKYDNVSYRTKYIEKEQYLLVEESGKEYYIDKNLNVVADRQKLRKEKGLIINYISSGLLRVRDNSGLLGISDLEGNIIIEPQYNAFVNETTYSGYFSVRQGHKYGILDLSGNEIIKPSDKYKGYLIGNGEYFVAYVTNTKLATMWEAIFILSNILEICLLRLIFKRKKNLASNN